MLYVLEIVLHPSLHSGYFFCFFLYTNRQLLFIEYTMNVFPNLWAQNYPKLVDML